MKDTSEGPVSNFHNYEYYFVNIILTKSMCG